MKNDFETVKDWPKFIEGLTLQLNISLRGLALSLGMSYRTFQDWKGGQREPDTAAKLLLVHISTCKQLQKMIRKEVKK